MSAPKVVPLVGTMTVGAASGKSAYSFTVPTGVVAGDVCTVAGTFTGASIPTVPAGWTAHTPAQQGTTMQQLIWTKVLVAADIGTDMAITFPAGVRGEIVAIIDSGTDGNPVFSAPTIVSTSSATAIGPAMTPTVPGSRVRVIASLRAVTAGAALSATPDPAATEIVESGTTSTTLTNFVTHVSDIVRSDTSAVPAQTITPSGSNVTYTTTTLVYAPTIATSVVKWRAPGTLRFGLFSKPGAALLPLTIRGIFDGKIVRPAHLKVPAAAVIGSTSGGGDGGGTLPDDPYAFRSSGLEGGGFQNVIAQSPSTDSSGNRVLIVGADVAGTHISNDGGASWTPSNVNMDTHTAAIRFHPTSSGEAAVLADSGLRRTTNFGKAWRKQAINVNAAGNGKVAELEPFGSEHPRHTGNLVVYSTDGSAMFIASKSGVKMSQDNGATSSWEVMTNDHIRGLAWNDATGALFVAVHNRSASVKTVPGGGDPDRNGVWQLLNATGSAAPTPTKLGTWPADPGAEELFYDSTGRVLYVAAHTAGCFAWNGTSWTQKQGNQAGATGTTYPANGLDVNSSIAYQAIHGRRDSSGNLVLYIGGAGASGVGGRSRAGRLIWRSSDLGVTWQCITNSTAATVDNHDIGSTDLSYISQIGYHRFANDTWVASQIVVDRDNVNKIYVAGRGGVWVGVFVSSTGKWKWQPSTTGLMVTVNMTVSCHPRDPGKVLIGSMDYITNESSNSGETFSPTDPIGSGRLPDGTALPAAQKPTTGDATSYDQWPKATGPVAAVVGVSLRGSPTSSKLNGVYFSADPHATSQAWTLLQFPESGDTWWPPHTDSAGKSVPGGNYDVPGVFLTRSSAGGQYVVFASVTTAGVYRITGDGATWNSWQKITDFGGGGQAFFVAKPNSKTIYAHVNGAVWRSDDAGTLGSWTKIYTAGVDYKRYNSIALDPKDPTKLYVAISSSGVYRINNASTATGISSNVMTLWSGDPGPICQSIAGVLYVSTRSGSLLRFNTPAAATAAAATAYANVANGFFTDNGRSIRAMDIDVAGRIYTADNGQGAMVGLTPA